MLGVDNPLSDDPDETPSPQYPQFQEPGAPPPSLPTAEGTAAFSPSSSQDPGLEDGAVVGSDSWWVDSFGLTVCGKRLSHGSARRWILGLVGACVGLCVVLVAFASATADPPAADSGGTPARNQAVNTLGGARTPPSPSPPPPDQPPTPVSSPGPPPSSRPAPPPPYRYVPAFVAITEHGRSPIQLVEVGAECQSWRIPRSQDCSGSAGARCGITPNGEICESPLPVRYTLCA
jgi:hypothetical protein